MNILEFKNKFKKIKDMGFVRSERLGATGIGYTLETLLGISENNDAKPDIFNFFKFVFKFQNIHLISFYDFFYFLYLLNTFLQ